jgi:dipeptidyl aminopeptidase/acylaminoacyl peptidase
MPEKQIARFGTWTSPITSDLAAAATVMLGEVRVDGDALYWTEGRPAEGGRTVIVRREPDGTTRDVTPPPFNARSRVHEYGGGAYLAAEGTVFFANFADNRLYRQDPEAEPRPITPEDALRYADGCADPRRGRIICVREDHRQGDREAVTTLTAIDMVGEAEQRVLVSGNDFYSSPRLSPDGTRLAWLTWNHPNMPWDGTQLWVGNVAGDGSIVGAEMVTGGEAESIFQPEWSPDGHLYFVSDRTGWWNIYRQREGAVEPITRLEAELGVPQWVFGLSTYAYFAPGHLAAVARERGVDRLIEVELQTGEVRTVETPYSVMSSVRSLQGRAVLIAGSATEPSSVVEVDAATGRNKVIRRSAEVGVDRAYFSVPDTIEFSTENGLTAHGFFYPPQNGDFAGPPDERPPLIVRSHGGPTSATVAAFNLALQYWTSRGFAYLDVNYGGSTGYGRPYRERLNGRWGVVDVEDCLNGARFLARAGKVDPNRLIITGGSAGGYTTLRALSSDDTFAAGSSHFGVADLEQLALETHKFESRYLERMVGPYPEQKDLYRERSPIYHADRISRPVILFQGLEDKVVPPNQAEHMIEVLQSRGFPWAYVAYEGEGHGFRKAENIKRTLDAELSFYAQVFGLQLPEPGDPVPVQNLSVPVP